MSRAESDAFRRYQAEMGPEAYDPNEECKACGLEVENYHYSCQGHQNCLPECPKCGGELVPIERDDRPHGEMQPIIDRMEEGDPGEERYEAWLDAEDAHLEADYEDHYEDPS